MRVAILKQLPPDAIRCFAECSHNVLNGNVGVSAAQKRKLRRFLSKLRQLAGKKVALSKKKKLLAQSGGAFPLAFLVPILTVAGSLLLDTLRK